MPNLMPIIDVCDNKRAHDEEAFFLLDDRTFYVLNIILPFTNTEDDEGVYFSMPTPELVHQLMKYRGATQLVVRHFLCQKCLDDVQLEIASVIRDSARF